MPCHGGAPGIRFSAWATLADVLDGIAREIPTRRHRIRAIGKLKLLQDYCQTQKSMTQLATPIEAAKAIDRVAAERRKTCAPARPAICQPRTMVQIAAPPSTIPRKGP